jgi:hypothetical protein
MVGVRSFWLPRSGTHLGMDTPTGGGKRRGPLLGRRPRDASGEGAPLDGLRCSLAPGADVLDGGRRRRKVRVCFAADDVSPPQASPGTGGAITNRRNGLTG